jgi:hypothetical protein
VLEKFDPDDADMVKRMRSMFGPQTIDQEIRRAIQYCWMSLPPEKQNVDAVEKEIRRLVDRALRDLREDASAFGA